MKNQKYLPSPPTHLPLANMSCANKGAKSNVGITSFQSKSLASSPPDTIEDLWRIIIDMIMSYTILQAHTEKENPRKWPKIKRSSSTPSTAVEASHQKSLIQIKSRHNNFPFLLYLLAGVRGIFISTQDHQSHSISECLEVLHVFPKIHAESQLPSLPHEKVWVNLGGYICEIFSSVRDFPDDVSKYVIPNRHQLAQCIAYDSINFTAKHYTSFNIPKTLTCQK